MWPRVYMLACEKSFHLHVNLIKIVKDDTVLLASSATAAGFCPSAVAKVTSTRPVPSKIQLLHISLIYVQYTLI